MRRSIRETKPTMRSLPQSCACARTLSTTTSRNVESSATSCASRRRSPTRARAGARNRNGSLQSPKTTRIMRAIYGRLPYRSIGRSNSTDKFRRCSRVCRERSRSARSAKIRAGSRRDPTRTDAPNSDADPSDRTTPTSFAYQHPHGLRHQTRSRERSQPRSNRASKPFRTMKVERRRSSSQRSRAAERRTSHGSTVRNGPKVVARHLLGA